MYKYIYLRGCLGVVPAEHDGGGGGEVAHFSRGGVENVGRDEARLRVDSLAALNEHLCVSRVSVDEL